MKNLFLLLFALLAFTACDDSGRDDVLPKKEGDGLVEVPVHIGLRPMVNAVTTRAENPLDPATENYMNSLRFFEFDQEGFHNRDEDYHEILLSQGHTSYPNITIQFHELSRTIVCVANVTPRNVEDLYNTYSGEGTEQEEGHITLADFKKWMIDVEYQQYDAETAYEKAFYSSVYEGLPVSMPMSAVFEGVPSDFQNKGITFYMGRLLTLLNFTLYFKSELNKPFGTEFYNVASQIHLFPGERVEVDRNWPPRFQIVDILPREGNAYWGPRESYKPGESVQRYRMRATFRQSIGEPARAGCPTRPACHPQCPCLPDCQSPEHSGYRQSVPARCKHHLPHPSEPDADGQTFGIDRPRRAPHHL